MSRWNTPHDHGMKATWFLAQLRPARLEGACSGRYRSAGPRVKRHHVSISNEGDGMGPEDLLSLADVANSKKDQVNALIDRVVALLRY